MERTVSPEAAPPPNHNLSPSRTIMSLIGRIFIVLNLGMAAAFLGWAANALHTTDDFKSQLETEKAERATQVAELTTTLDEAQAKLRQAEDDLRTRTEAVNTTQSAADSFKSQMEEAKREAAQLGAQLDTISATLSDYNDTISQMNGQKDDATQRASEAERERDDAVEAQQTAELAQRDAEEAAAGLQQTIADMQVQMTDLQGEYSSLETQLQMLIEVTGVSPQLLRDQPLIEGRVLEARHDLAPGLVMLNIGSAENVKRGYTFEVYAGGVYKGQVRVVDVQESICSAVVVNAVSGTTMGQGDAVATRI